MSKNILNVEYRLYFSSCSCSVSVVQWNEDVYEKQLIERTRDACGGPVDVVIDFGTTSRSLHRSLHCLGKGGVVLISEEVAERLLPKFARLADEREQRIRAVRPGTVEQLHELVQLVADNKVREEFSSRIILNIFDFFFYLILDRTATTYGVPLR